MTLHRLDQLHPGTRFRCPWNGLAGELLFRNDARARVRVQITRPRTIVPRNGDPPATITIRQEDADWSPGTAVELIA